MINDVISTTILLFSTFFSTIIILFRIICSTWFFPSHAMILFRQFDIYRGKKWLDGCQPYCKPFKIVNIFIEKYTICVCRPIFPYHSIYPWIKVHKLFNLFRSNNVSILDATPNLYDYILFAYWMMSYKISNRVCVHEIFLT